MSNNTINYTKIYRLGGQQETPEYVPPTKEEIIGEIEDIPAVAVRGHLDHLLKVDTSKEESVWGWNRERLEDMNTYDLQYLLTFVTKRYEAEKARQATRPIIRHTSS